MNTLKNKYFHEIAFKFLSGILIVIMFADFTIPNAVFFYNKNSIQREVEEIFKKDFKLKDIEYLKISKSEISNKSVFQWKHSKEFRYRGAMYDIVDLYATVDSPGYKIFKVKNDTKEEELINKFTEKKGHSPFSDILQKIKNFVFDGSLEFITWKPNLNFKIISYFNIKEISFSFNTDVESPPPKNS